MDDKGKIVSRFQLLSKLITMVKMIKMSFVLQPNKLASYEV